MRYKRMVVFGGLALLAIAGAAAWREWPVRVEVAQAVRGPAVEAVYATGIVEPSVMLPVAPRTSGRLVALNADEGAKVRKGQVLARIEALDLEHTVTELTARQRLAQEQLDRTRTLVEQKFLSSSELDRTRTELDAAQAALKRAEAQRDYNLLVAPADGVILRRDGEIGQFIPAGQTVLTLSCCAPLRVAAEIDEEDIAKIQLGQKVVMRGDALPGQVFDGEVGEITPKGDPVARSYRVRIRFKDKNPEATGLRVGMTMDANVILSQREGVLLVPNRALTNGSVWVVEHGAARRQQVKTGIAGTERTEIVAGLADDSTVVLSPPDTLRDGRHVSTEAATPAAASAAPAAR